MSNPFYYLFGLLLVFTYPTGKEPLTFLRDASNQDWIAPAAVAVSLALYALLTAAVHRSIRARSRLHVLGLARMMLRMTALLLLGVLIFVFHLRLHVWTVFGRANLLVDALVTLLPLFGFFGILSIASARFDAGMRAGGAGGVLGFAFRSFLGLSFLPLLAMLGLYAALDNIEPLWRMAFVYPFVGWGVVILWILLLLVFLPLLLRFALAARPMPEGPLRERLEILCRTVGFDYGRLLVVDTGAVRMANAFIVGLGRPWRYVFFTDAILAGMSADELECVLAHEIVHSKKRHMLFYLFFTIGFTLASVLAFEVLAGLPEVFLVLILLSGGLVYWIGAFGYVSRRFETEADLVAARWVPAPAGAPEPYRSARGMAGALERVALLNRASLTGWSWRHFNIATRVGILMGAETDPAVGEAFERQCRRLRAAALAFLVAGAGAGAVLAVDQADRAEEARAKLAAYDRAERGRRMFYDDRFTDAAVELRAGIAAGWAEPSVWALLAECERRLGREAEAEKAEAEALKGGVLHPLLRLQLEK